MNEKNVYMPPEVRKAARGEWQRGLLDRMWSGWVTNPTTGASLKGRASHYSPIYRRSFVNLQSRLSELGYELWFKPGPKGGAWAGEYRLAPRGMSSIVNSIKAAQAAGVDALELGDAVYFALEGYVGTQRAQWCGVSYREALEEFQGTLVVVSHDREFIDNVANRCWVMEDGGEGQPPRLTDWRGDYANYRSSRGLE